MRALQTRVRKRDLEIARSPGQRDTQCYFQNAEAFEGCLTEKVHFNGRVREREREKRKKERKRQSHAGAVLLRHGSCGPGSSSSLNEFYAHLPSHAKLSIDLSARTVPIHRQDKLMLLGHKTSGPEKR